MNEISKPASTPDTPSQSAADCSANTTANSRNDVEMSLILFLLSAFTVLMSMALAWPNIYEWMKSGPPAPVIIAPLGEVKQIHYIGGLGTDTQIDLSNQSILVRGVAILEKGVVLELHS